MDVGVIGLGAMGSAMARNLAAAGHRVKAWNRSGGTIKGVTMVRFPVDALQGEAALTMLADDAAIREVLLRPGVLEQAKAGPVNIVASTISVAFAKHLVELHERRGIGYVSAPVLGRPDVATKGELNVIVGGAPSAVDTIRPVLEAMAEGVVLTEANGLRRERLFELILGTLFGSRAYQVYSANIANENYQPDFKATLGLKDLRLAREVAEQGGRTLPMLDAVHHRMAETIDAGMGNRYRSAMADFTINKVAPNSAASLP
jgi:3-hydroxyisobutyrate dehydrogenase-like beta-hydroxyacid dehydrogenase